MASSTTASGDGSGMGLNGEAHGMQGVQGPGQGQGHAGQKQAQQQQQQQQQQQHHHAAGPSEPAKPSTSANGHGGPAPADSGPSSGGTGSGSGNPAKRPKGDGSREGKTKRVPSCDICRMRKVKCVKPDTAPGARCQGCIELDRACTYNYCAKKPGPPNPYSRSAIESYTPYPPPRQRTSSSNSIPHGDALGRYGPGGEHAGGFGGGGGGAGGSSSSSGFGHAPMHLSPLGGAADLPSHGAGQGQGYRRDSDVGAHAPHGLQHGRTYSMSRGSREEALGQHAPQNQHRSHAYGGGPGGGPGPGPGSAGSGGFASASLPPLGPSPSSASTGFTPPNVANFDIDMGDEMFRPWVCSAPDPASGGGVSTGPSTGGIANRPAHDLAFHDPAINLGTEYDWDLSAPGPSGPRRSPGESMHGHNAGSGPGQGSMAMRVDEHDLGAAFGDFDAALGVGAPGPGGGAQGGAEHMGRTRSSIASQRSVGGPSAPTGLANIEDLLRWSQVLNFLSLYFEHLYPLLPLMHWPSFSQQLIARQDKKDPTFRAFLLSLVAYSILQLPKSVIPSSFTQKELMDLHKACHAASRRLQPRLYEPALLLHISTLYCDHIYLGSTGKDNAANAILAEAMRLAISMGLHDDSVADQQGMDEIEKETRRRVFWVLYGSDRTIAALISCPMLLSDEDIFVSEPLEVDDSLITAAGSFQQPRGRTPVISGFVHVTRIFRLLSRVLRLVRQRARAQAVDANTDSFPDPRTLIHSLQALLDDLPPPLRLQTDIHEQRNQQDSNAFETCKANLLVNQVLVRFAIYQYAMLRSAGRPEQYLDELTEDVLKTLHNMSSESLAANGESIRRKVLFIASSLLNKYPSDNAGHDHVSDFLNVYNKILREQTATGIVNSEDKGPQEQNDGADGQLGMSGSAPVFAV